MVQIAVQDIYAQTKQINQQQQVDSLKKTESPQSEGFLQQLSLLNGQFYSDSTTEKENDQK